MGQLLDSGDAVDVPTGSVKLLCTGHGLPVGAVIFISGTTNYDGYHTLTAVGTDDFTFVATFVAETFGGSTETVEHLLLPGELFRLVEVRLHLNSSGSTTQNFTVTLDSGENAVYDAILDDQDTDDLPDHNQCWGKDACHHMKATDALIFAWANSDSKTWGLEVVYDVMQG
jgi:hypothetical protein